MVLVLAVLTLCCLLMPTSTAADTHHIQKPYRMTILEMFLPSDKAFPLGCHAAAQLVVDLVNNRSDILPDYHIETQLKDEGRHGNLSPKLVVQYAEQDQEANASYLSPFIFGPFSSDGCKAVGRFLQYIDQVAISPNCGAIELNDHKTFPNLYLSLSTTQGSVVIASMLKTVGFWSRLAIISDINEYQYAVQVHQLAIMNGIEVIWFNVVLDVDSDIISSLKSSDARVVFTYNNDQLLMLKIFCRTYLAGMRGARYIFLTTLFAFVNPMTLPDPVMPQCSRKMVIEQMQITFWGLSSATGEFQPLPSTLGLTTRQFDKMLNGPRYFNGTMPSDYLNRFFCHDAMLRGLFSLDEADRQLQRKNNLTLRDYNRFPKIVMKAVNDSIRTSRLMGLRTGRLEYDDQGRNSFDEIQFFYFSLRTGMQVIYSSDLFSSNDGVKFSGYYIKQVRTFDWTAWNGRIPQDRLTTKQEVYDVSQKATAAVLVFAGLCSLSQATEAVLTFKAMKYNNAQGRHFSQSKMLGFTASILVNVAAASFAVRSTEAPVVAWIVRSCLLAVSGSLVIAIYPMQILSILYITKTIAPTMPRVHRFAAVLAHADYVTLSYTLRYAAVLGVFLISIFLADPLQCTLSIVPKLTGYSLQTDTYSEIKAISCTSRYMLVWRVLFYCWNMFVLLGAGVLFLLFRPRRSTEMNLIGIGLGNSITLLFCVLLVLLAYDGYPIEQQIIVAVSCLLITVNSSSIWFYSIVKNARKTNRTMPGGVAQAGPTSSTVTVAQATEP